MDSNVIEDEDVYYKTLLKELNEILQEYRIYLEQKGFKKKYIQQQLDYISFFGTNFMINYCGHSILEVDEDLIYEFLGSWCLRKVIYFKKADILPILSSFKKFFNFLLYAQKITKAEYNEIMEILKDSRRFIDKFERYEDLNSSSENWEDEYESWLYDYNIMSKNDLKKDLISILNKEKKFISRLSEGMNSESFSIVKDFKTFGNYIINFKDGIGLTNNIFCLKRNDLLKLNSIMTVPEDLPKTIFQKDTVLLHCFFLTSKRLGLFKYTKKMKFKSTSLYLDFLKLSGEKQYWLLFNAFWDKISWFRLNAYSWSGRPEWIFADRFLYASFFASLKPNEWYAFRELEHIFYKEFLSSSYEPHGLLFFGVFYNKILPLLTYFELFKINLKIPLSYENFRNLKLMLTPLGKEFFSILEEIVNKREEQKKSQSIKKTFNQSARNDIAGLLDDIFKQLEKG